MRLRLKSPALRLFTQPFIQAQIKENITALRHWLLCGEFTGTGEFPKQMASNTESVSIWWRHHDYISLLIKKMTLKYTGGRQNTLRFEQGNILQTAFFGGGWGGGGGGGLLIHFTEVYIGPIDNKWKLYFHIRQAMTWTNGSPAYMRIYAQACLRVLTGLHAKITLSSRVVSSPGFY